MNLKICFSISTNTLKFECLVGIYLLLVDDKRYVMSDQNKHKLNLSQHVRQDNLKSF